jgi:hypothetical protein
LKYHQQIPQNKDDQILLMLVLLRGMLRSDRLVDLLVRNTVELAGRWSLGVGYLLIDVLDAVATQSTSVCACPSGARILVMVRKKRGS